MSTIPHPRAAANRANAQHSTGPTSAPGKLRSSQNSFRHGLYSTALIVPDEDPAEFDRLRASLRREHQPANTTEEILVDELAQHFWRIRRFRELEARSWDPDNLDGWTRSGLFDKVARAMHSAERSFHRALSALVILQKQRGFVPSEIAPPPQHDSKTDTRQAPQPHVQPSSLPTLTSKPRAHAPTAPISSCQNSGTSLHDAQERD